MNPPAERALVVLAVHARRVPAAEREQFAGRLRARNPGGLVVVETCHRVEAYMVGAPDPGGLARQLGLPPGGQVLVDEAAIRHVMAVAVGRDSVVVGEDQILHQVREAVDAARRESRREPHQAGRLDGRLDTDLERLFDRALQAGRRARSWHQGPQRSLADVAVGTIEELVGPLAGREILVVGAGRMGRLAARAGIHAGASVAIANRTAAVGSAAAAASGARSAPFDPGSGVAGYAGIVVALAGRWPIGPATIAALAAASTVVVDLSVPDALEPDVTAALGPRLVSADALAHSLDSSTARTPAAMEATAADHRRLARLDRLIEEATREHLDWLNGRQGRATAEALVEQADREREAELAELWQHLPDLQPEARAAIDGMTRHLARRLLREPLERLGRDADGRDEQVVRDIFAL